MIHLMDELAYIYPLEFFEEKLEIQKQSQKEWANYKFAL